MLPPIQRVASVSERSGSNAKRPPRAPRSTTSPVLSSPKRWTFDDVPEAQDEDAEVGKDSVFGAFGMTNGTMDIGAMSRPSAGTGNNPLGIENIVAGQNTQVLPKSGQSISRTTTQTGFTLDFDDNFRLNSLDLNDIEEETPLSPSQPAPPPQQQPSRRSRSPQKHWALPPLMTNSTKDRHLGRRPISDGAVSSGSSLSSVTRSQSVVTLNTDLAPPASAQVQLSPVTLLKPAKQRKSILNPMSLLNRRRTSQGGDVGSSGGIPGHMGTVIRGTGVHDFDKPRTRRNLSTNDMDGYNAHSRGDVSPSEEYRRRADAPPWSEQEEDAAAVTETARKQTVPAFKENFEDDGDENGDGVRRETLANQAFLARVQDHIGPGPHSPSPPPMVLEKPKDLGPPVLPATPQLSEIGSLAPAINIIEGTPNPDDSASAFPEYTSQEQQTQDIQDMPSPPRPQSRDWTKESLTPRVARVSNASDTSRWSFMPGDPSAVQERLMEQAHTDREAQQQAEEKPEQSDTAEDDRNESDGGSVSDYGTEGSYYEEEPIPGADDEDEDGGVRMNVNMPSSTRVPQLRDFPAPATGHPHMMQEGLGLSIPQELPSASMYDHMQSDRPGPQPPSPSVEDNDDMYFNDGEIEEPSPIDDDMIDESLFDRVEKKEQAMNAHLLANDSATAEDGEASPTRDMLREPDKHVDMPLQDANLHAYHSALAVAAAKAEATGKFQHEAISPRQQSEDERSEDGYGLPEQLQQQPPNELPQNNMYYYQQPDEEEQPYWQDNDYDDFDPELDLTSDDIAAANAEALAADDSGFYGREFNFYSRITKGSTTEQMSGGYFGTPGKDSGNNRSASMRDPILTPITERSEFSRAPSFMSMGSPLFGPSSFTAAFQAASKSNSPMMPNLPFRSADGQFLHPSSPAMPSPGLKELAGQMGLNHDDMTLKQLMKLRQQALGTAGLSPVMAHFSPSSPSAPGLSQYSNMGPGNGQQASLSPHSGAYSASPLLSSPLSGRSVNVPSPNPSSALSSLDTQPIKLGPVPDHAQRRSLRSSLNAATSSPPSDERGGSSIARSSLGPADDYFSPDSPASPFSYAGSPVNAGPAYGLGLDVADFGYLQQARMDVDDNDVAVESEDEYDSDADAEGDDEDDDEDGDAGHYSSSPPQAQSSSPANVQPKYKQMRPLSLHAHPVTAEDYMSPAEPNFDLQDSESMFAPLAVTKLELDMPGGMVDSRREVSTVAT